MSMQVLFTAFAMLLCGAAAYFAFRAGVSAEKASHSEARLTIMRGQVKGLEVGLTALDEQHKKLAGRVYADQYWRGKREEQPELVPTMENDPGAPCENWKLAQQAGPNSTAAQCDCTYCNAKREERRQRRASMRSGVS